MGTTVHSKLRTTVSSKTPCLSIFGGKGTSLNLNKPHTLRPVKSVIMSKPRHNPSQSSSYFSEPKVIPTTLLYIPVNNKATTSPDSKEYPSSPKSFFQNRKRCPLSI